MYRVVVGDSLSVVRVNIYISTLLVSSSTLTQMINEMQENPSWDYRFEADPPSINWNWNCQGFDIAKWCSFPFAHRPVSITSGFFERQTKLFCWSSICLFSIHMYLFSVLWAYIFSRRTPPSILGWIERGLDNLNEVTSHYWRYKVIKLLCGDKTPAAETGGC